MLILDPPTSIPENSFEDEQYFKYWQKIHAILKFLPQENPISKQVSELFGHSGSNQFKQYDEAIPYRRHFQKFQNYMQKRSFQDFVRSVKDPQTIENYNKLVFLVLNLPSLVDDVLHNFNCFRYLQQLKKVNNKLQGLDLEAIKQAIDSPYFQASIAYGDLYKKLMQTLDQEGLDADLLQALYENDNHNLEETFDVFKTLILDYQFGDKALSKQISGHIKQKSRINQNSLSPKGAETRVQRFQATFISENYKPQHETSIPSIRTYSHNENAATKEIRMGTQAQKHDGAYRVSPMFKAYIDSKSSPHVYFNFLGRDELPEVSGLNPRYNFSQMERTNEAALTRALEALESEKLKVITLPANKGYMALNEFESTDPYKSREEVFNILKNILVGLRSEGEIQDFYISKQTREALGKNLGETLEKLLHQSFIDILGEVNDDTLISKAQMQAVWFHFNRYHLPKFVLETIKPTTYNFSCKDGIDRGGAASAYFNLLSSFDTENPMSREEFETALHAAPALVKGRGMNGHQNMIWNALHYLLKQNYQAYLNDPKKSWLIEWHNLHCPKGLLKSVAQEALENLQKTLDEKIEPDKIIVDGLTIINNPHFKMTPKESLSLVNHLVCMKSNSGLNGPRKSSFEILVDQLCQKNKLGTITVWFYKLLRVLGLSEFDERLKHNENLVKLSIFGKSPEPQTLDSGLKNNK